MTERSDIQHQLRLATDAAMAVLMPVGLWAGNGIYATWSDAARDKAGVQALADLDAALVDLAEVRGLLAAAVPAVGEQPRTFGRGDTIPPDVHRLRRIDGSVFVLHAGVWHHEAADGSGTLGWAATEQELLAAGVTEIPAEDASDV